MQPKIRQFQIQIKIEIETADSTGRVEVGEGYLQSCGVCGRVREGDRRLLRLECNDIVLLCRDLVACALCTVHCVLFELVWCLCSELRVVAALVWCLLLLLLLCGV